jgi:hypothetical protein
MNKTTSTQKVPTANIAVNKSRIKVYNKSGEMPTCYLQKGQEFQIELFNPTTNVVLAKIELNGRLISQSGLVLNPGERVFLDRYIDVAQKFLFDTYEVGKSEEVKEAIKNNGDIKVYFYNEEVKIPVSYPVITNYPLSPSVPSWQQYWYYNSMSSPSSLGIGSSGTAGGSVTTTDLKSVPTNTNSVTTDSIGSASYYSSDITYTTNGMSSLTSGSIDFAPQELSRKSSPIRSRKLSKTIETGRVEQGSHSNQSFKYVSKDFYSYPFHTVEYKLLPVSQKTISVDELMVKRYCTNCGSKVGKTDKFCSKCGTKI